MPDDSRAPGNAVRIVIADDHPIFRSGLRRLLESEPGLSVIGEAGSGHEALRLLEVDRPDLLLLDLSMPGMGGLEALAHIDTTAVRIVLLTAEIRRPAVIQALQLGVRGIVLKESAAERLLEAIPKVMSGQVVIGEGVIEELVDAVRQPDRAGPRPYGLTDREREIVRAIGAGRCNKEIAQRLDISLQTVKHHLTSIFAKTGVTSRLELAIFAAQHRIADDE
jgi:two-component system, NarL family, nitrate/nitrite response regulator NarL